MFQTKLLLQVLLIMGTITNGAELKGIYDIFKTPHAINSMDIIPNQLNEWHSRIETDTTFINGLFTDGNKDTFKDDAVSQIRTQFAFHCFGVTQNNSATNKTLVYDAIEQNMNLFYKTQDGVHHKIFDKQQLTNAMVTLTDAERHMEHDDFKGYLVLYHLCDRYFLNYKDINFGGKLFSYLTQQPPKAAKAPAAMNAVSTIIESKLERVCKVLEN